MRPKSETQGTCEQVVKDIRRATRKQYSIGSRTATGPQSGAEISKRPDRSCSWRIGLAEKSGSGLDSNASFAIEVQLNW